MKAGPFQGNTMPRIKMILNLALLTAIATPAFLLPGACGQEGRSAPAPAPTTATSSGAREPAAPASPEDIAFAKRLSNAFKSVARQAEPSVVHITQLNTVTYRRSFFDDRGTSKVVPTGLGSGFVVSRDGYIVTNNHVVKGAEQLKVKLDDGRELEAKLIGRDELTDLAVIQVQARDLALTPLVFGDSDNLDVGEWVLAIG